MNRSTVITIAVLCAAMIAATAIAASYHGNGGSSDSGSEDGTTEVQTDFTITYDIGDECHEIETVDGETVVTFSDATSDIECILSGSLEGSIVIDIDGTYDFKLTLDGATISSHNEAPIAILSADNATISAKNGTSNSIYDHRSEITDDDGISSAVYSTTDLDIQGRGSLYVYSENNNGIHSKDDLDVKNLTLTVVCTDNALKGNDSVTLLSGTILLTSEGDGIKTTNTDSKTRDDGAVRQEGIITICSDKGDLSLTVTAGCDAIDASYGVEIDETEGTVTLVLTTGSRAGYPVSSIQTVGSAPGAPSGIPGNGWGGNSPPDDDRDSGYSDSISRKGIKGDAYVIISGGTVSVSSDDDSIHSNGHVTISGGVLSLVSGDDGIHADGALSVTGGTVGITECYEGLEGSTVSISGGVISIVSSDDGINSTSTYGVGISISGGNVYILAGGDGLDSNSTTRYSGFSISGGDVTVISTGNADSALDTENGYSFTGGRVLAVSVNGGMAMGECINCQSFSSIGTSTSLNVSGGRYVTVTVGDTLVSAAKLPSSMSAFVVYLGSSSAKISTSSSVSGTDSDGTYWS